MKALTDLELITRLKSCTREERRLTAVILEYLREVDGRRLYADYNYPSLWEFCVKELGYTEGAAARRIHSMRLLREVPELRADIVEGRQSLMSLTQAQVFFRAEEKQLGRRLTTRQKIGVLRRLENKSARECARELDKLATVPKPRMMSVEIDEALLAKLRRIRELRSHAQPNASEAELLHHVVDEFLKRADPMLKPMPKKRETPALKVALLAKRKAIPASIKQRVWLRDRGRCTACGSRHFVELDHIRPVARGGLSTPDNLRLRCRAHNQRTAIKMGLIPRNGGPYQLRPASTETTSPSSQTTENSIGLQQT